MLSIWSFDKPKNIVKPKIRMEPLRTRDPLGFGLNMFSDERLTYFLV